MHGSFMQGDAFVDLSNRAASGLTWTCAEGNTQSFAQSLRDTMLTLRVDWADHLKNCNGAELKPFVGSC